MQKNSTQLMNLKLIFHLIKYKNILKNIITINSPIRNHLKPLFLKRISNLPPNFIDKYATIKNANPLKLNLLK